MSDTPNTADLGELVAALLEDRPVIELRKTCADLLTAQQREIEGLKLKIDGADFFCEGRVEAYKQEAAAAKAKAEALEKERDDAQRELSCCDDISLGSGLATGISELQTDRERLRAEVAELRAKLSAATARADSMRTALKMARNLFADYERLHLAKAPPDLAKAERNCRAKIVCDMALSDEARALTIKGDAEGGNHA